MFGDFALPASLVAGFATWWTLGRTARWENAEGYAQFPVAYVGAAMGVAVVLGAFFPRRVLVITAGMAAASALSAVFTTARGDGDGLWTLIFVWILFTSAWVFAGAFVSGWLRMLLQRIVRQDDGGRTR